MCSKEGWPEHRPLQPHGANLRGEPLLESRRGFPGGFPRNGGNRQPKTPHLLRKNTQTNVVNKKLGRKSIQKKTTLPNWGAERRPGNERPCITRRKKRMLAGHGKGQLPNPSPGDQAVTEKSKSAAAAKKGKKKPGSWQVNLLVGGKKPGGKKQINSALAKGPPKIGCTARSGGGKNRNPVKRLESSQPSQGIRGVLDQPPKIRKEKVPSKTKKRSLFGKLQKSI